MRTFGGITLLLTALLLELPVVPVSAQVVLAASGPDPASILTTVNQYRDLLGPLNPNNPGIENPNGRREINWDAVPDAFSAPNLFPGDFLNAPVFPRARGAEFTTPGAGFMLSADDDNPTNTPPEYANIDPSYPGNFQVFSPPRLFIALDSVITDVFFFVAGTDIRATVTGFGAVFSDVDLPDTTKMEYYDINDNLLYSAFVPPGVPGNESMSFLGVKFDSRVVARVRIFSGNTPLNAGVLDDLAGGTDLVVMDDFIYGEPVPEPAALTVLGMGLAVLSLRRRR